MQQPVQYAIFLRKTGFYTSKPIILDSSVKTKNISSIIYSTMFSCRVLPSFNTTQRMLKSQQAQPVSFQTVGFGRGDSALLQDQLRRFLSPGGVQHDPRIVLQIHRTTAINGRWKSVRWMACSEPFPSPSIPEFLLQIEPLHH